MLPPEWWPQSAVMLTWPHAQGDWGAGLASVEQVFIDLAVVISRRQGLIVSVHSEQLLEPVTKRLNKAGADMAQIRLYSAASNDIWVRDHGPLTVVRNGQPRLLDFSFNGWGGKYPADYDNAITRSLHTQGAFANTDIESLDYVIEGGGIEANGEGCLLTTRNCLALPSRNPGMGEAVLEQLFAEQLGCPTTHWLSHGHLAGDDTDGHIDTLARYTSPDCIAYQGCDIPGDEHFEPLQCMADELASLRRPDGRGYTLQVLPMPAPIYNAQGQRLPAGYANFLIINNAVLMPSYADPADHKALEILAGCFTDREVIAIDCRALVEQFGSLHCATMQLPAGVVPA